VLRAVAFALALLSILAAGVVLRAARAERALRRINAAGGTVISFSDPLPFSHHWLGPALRSLVELYPVRDKYEITFHPSLPGWCGTGMTLGRMRDAVRDPGDVGLAPLRDLGGVSTLYLTDTSVSDAGLATLGGLATLELLDLSGTQVLGPGLDQLPHASLTSLSLARTGVDDASLAHVDGFPALYHLNLAETRVTGAGLAQLSRLPSLRALILDGTAIDDGAVGQLSSLRVDYLSLSSTAVTDAAIEPLERMTRLNSVTLCNTRVTDVALARSRSAALRAWPHLRSLCPPGLAGGGTR
jgi:hypothetical protein